MELRSYLLGLGTLLGIATFAQPIPPYNVTVGGIVLGCTPNSFVNISTNSITQPVIDIEVPLDANCGFSIDLLMDSFYGGFILTTPCSGALLQSAVAYQVNTLQPDSTSVFVTFNCIDPVTDCVGVFGGTNLPGTPCSDNNPLTINDTWNSNCECTGGSSSSCNACFTVSQTGSTPNTEGIPWSMTFSNCTSGGSAPYSYTWAFWDGSVSTLAEPTVVVSAAGTYMTCLSITDGNGCESMTCDSVIVDTNGTVDPVDTVACQAAFFAMQAYQWVDSISNPNGGGGEPIPNELWLWNLSTGSGSYQYVWSWGDGTSSSEAYPTHTYAGSGTYTICLTMGSFVCTSTYCQDITVDGDGILGGFMGEGNRATFSVNVMDPLALGVTELPSLTNVSLWPNPATNVLNLSLSALADGRLNVTLFDVSGRAVQQENRVLSVGRNLHHFDIGLLPPGVYTLRVTDRNGNSTSQRFAKAN